MIGAVILGFASLGAGSLFEEASTAGVAGAILGILALATFIVAIGLWRLRNWARIIATSVYSLSAVFGLVALFRGDTSDLPQLIVAGNIAAYLCRNHVRAAFRGENFPSPSGQVSTQ